MPLRDVTGVLLINLGTPLSCRIADIARYLREFLSDPRVIELPRVLRWLLVNCIIVPFRSKKTANAYSKIWQPNGSPLLINSLHLRNSLAQALGDKYLVGLGVRYGAPNINTALQYLQQVGVAKIVIVPLFPQYSSAATGSPLEQILNIVSKYNVVPELKIITEFYKHPKYIGALAASVQPYLNSKYDYLLLSYHGLPVKNSGAYKEQCYQTSKLLVQQLNIPAAKCGVSFQSRLGRIPWLKPYTDEMLVNLSKQGVKRLIVCCPSFVADCLETLEEIGIRASEQWYSLGGESLQLVPSLNVQPLWLAALADMIVTPA